MSKSKKDPADSKDDAHHEPLRPISGRLIERNDHGVSDDGTAFKSEAEKDAARHEAENVGVREPAPRGPIVREDPDTVRENAERAGEAARAVNAADPSPARPVAADLSTMPLPSSKVLEAKKALGPVDDGMIAEAKRREGKTDDAGRPVVVADPAEHERSPDVAKRLGEPPLVVGAKVDPKTDRVEVPAPGTFDPKRRLPQKP